MSGRRKWILLAAAAALLTSAAAAAPSVLRRFDSFAVERLEIRGTRYLAPYDAVVQSGITGESNVFDDFEPWRARLLKHPMIVAASIERHLPHTVRVSIAEAEPIALARTPELRPVDTRGQALPIEPAGADLDLPLLSIESQLNGDGVIAHEETRRAISVLAALHQHDARLFSWVSEAGPLRDHGVRLELRSPAGAEALVSAETRSLRLAELHVALADLAARGELSQLKRIDARFHDQIVVVLTRSGPGATVPLVPADSSSSRQSAPSSATINGN